MPPCKCSAKSARKSVVRDPETGEKIEEKEVNETKKSSRERRISRMSTWSAVSGMATKEMYYKLMRR